MSKKHAIGMDCPNCGFIHGSGFFKLKLVKGNSCVDWPVKNPCLLTITVKPITINGIKLQSKIEEALPFGKAEVVYGVDGDIVLNYLKNGLVLEYEQDRLVYVGVIIRPQDDISALPNTKGANAVLEYNEKINLINNTKAETIIQIFGKPEIDDIDSEERIMTNSVDGISFESEFTSDGMLKRFNLFPKKL